tara:strand:- start:919 stop:1938 length:1020 start_codon:yes stop_codon:yes gene_type:complete
VKNIITILISILISLLTVELFLRFFLPFPLSGSWRTQDFNGLLLNKKNLNTKHEYIVDEKIIRANYTFGNFHNRIYKGIDYDKSNPKILILGDSFTFGWLLNDEDTFIYKLANNKSHLDFINVSAGGWGTSDYLSYIENYCIEIKPKVILLFINNTDHERVINSNLYFLDKEMNLVKGKNKINKFKKILNEFFLYEFMIENSHLLQMLRSISNLQNIENQNKYRFNKESENRNFDKNITQVKKIYLKIDDEVNKCNSKVIFINLSWPFDVSNSHFKKINNEIFSFLEEKKFNLISLKDEMKTVSANLELYEIPVDKHPNSNANNFIYKTLIKKKLFKDH